jgi:hypothetical protein
LLRHLVSELVRIEVVVSEFDCWVSLACHLCSFLRTVFLGGLEVEAVRCIGREIARDYRFSLRSAPLRIRVRLLESGGERIQLHSLSRPTSNYRNNPGKPKNKKKRKEEEKPGVFE